jgi:hypothetical protein
MSLPMPDAEGVEHAFHEPARLMIGTASRAMCG